MKTVNYINLTNGIEALGRVDNPRFLRIQSSHCESKQWEAILNSASDDLLLNLAIGNDCFIYDYSNKNKMPKSLKQGLYWIQYCLYRAWLPFNMYTPKIKGHDLTKYYSKQYKKLSRKTLKRIKYFRKFLNTDILWINYGYGKTVHDGDYKYFREKLINDTKRNEIGS